MSSRAAWVSRSFLLHQSQTNLGFRGFHLRSLMRASSSMGTNDDGSSSSGPNIAEVSKVQLLLNNDSTDGWDKCWEQGLTPWDLGAPTPILVQLLQTGTLPKGRVLVPGCGSGYDVVAMAGPERYVIGLDISANALNKAKQLHSSSSKADYIEFLMEDFFTWHPSEQFDLIFDYTFFCAIEPSMRVAWANQMQDLLKPGGELITLMFPISDHVGGPPYKVSLADYEEFLHPIGFEASLVEDNELAVGQRKGKEKVGRWKRIEKQSHL